RHLRGWRARRPRVAAAPPVRAASARVSGGRPSIVRLPHLEARTLRLPYLEAHLEVVPLVARRVVSAVLALVAARLELVHHLVEVVADVLAELLPHLPHPARHALRVLLVEAVERGRVGEVVEAAVLRPYHGEAGHEPREVAAAAPVTDGVDGLAGAEREDGHLPFAAAAAVLVDQHTRDALSRRCLPTP